MAKFRFRPTIQPLEPRETPSVSPGDVFAAQQQTEVAREQLTTMHDQLGRPRDKGTIAHYAAALPALSNESANAVNVLTEYLNQLQSQLAANNTSAGAISGAIATVSADIQSAQTNAMFAAAYSIGFGASPSLYPPPPGSVRPPTVAPDLPLPPASTTSTLPTADLPAPVRPATPTEPSTGITPVPPVTPPPPVSPPPPVTPPVSPSPPVTPPPPVSPPPVTTFPPLSTTIPDVNSPNFVNQGNGVKIWDVRAGAGTAATTRSTIKVNYTGFLLNGTVFDSTDNRGGVAATFPVSGLIQGFQQGVTGMMPGGIRRLYIPSALAYGVNGSPPSIPPNSDIVFEVQLISTT